jgi:ABC-type polysaccharide/polyol phosphate transport system ATPase subunit
LGIFTAVNAVIFNIFEGELVGISDSNGAGKKTTLQLLTGIFKLEEGRKGESKGGKMKLFIKLISLCNFVIYLQILLEKILNSLISILEDSLSNCY